jgi:pilus assembly protein Flp/PilA
MEGGSMTASETFTSTACRLIKRFCADENGATAIEYAMIASGISIAISTMVYTLGGTVKTLFTTVSSALG